MKKLFLAIGILAICITSISQEIQHEAVAVNIEVPVRVFHRDTFIDDLTINDFELYEEGVLQNIEAVYLIKKTTIEKEEKPETTIATFKPKVESRHFVLAFETVNWVPRIDESIDYFFANVFQSQDSLVMITPVKSYNLSRKAIENMPKDRICTQFKSILRKDIVSGNREYKEIFRDYRKYEELRRYGEFGDQIMKEMQRTLFFKLRDYKYFDEEKLSTFADYLKSLEGQKHIFLFYQKEEIPYPDDATVTYGERVSRDMNQDSEQIKRIFSDSSITTHFLFLTNKPHETIDVENRENLQILLSDQSYSVFSAFDKVAKATGGMTYASSNPFSALQKAADASENYYLLYYTPKGYKSDGKFHNIKVKIKGKNYRVLHRAGYLAD